MTFISQEFLDDLLAQEERLQFPSFDNDTAIALGLLLVELGRSRSLPITVDVRRAGQQLFHAALPGTSADNDEWVIRKNSVVMRFGHSSYYMGRRAALKDVPFHEAMLVDPREFAAHGGAFPIRVIGTGLIGTVTVSGLPQHEDHALVVEAIEGFLARQG